MGLKSEILNIHSILKRNNIDHALIGGFALAVHGISRATGDLDLLIDEKDKNNLISALKAESYLMVDQTPEVLHFQGKVRLDVLLARRPISQKMLERASVTEILNMKCLDAEDLIGLKIQAYCNNRKRELQDKADIQFLFNKYPHLDLGRVKFYADTFGEWEEILTLKGRT